MPKVLVLDANQRSALAIIRSLGRHGVGVVAGDHLANSLGSASKYSSLSVVYSDPEKSPALFVREMITISRHHRVDTIIPATDLTTMILVSQPELSQFADIVAPPAASYEALTDKARLLELAASLQIAVPETRIADTRTAVEEAVREFGFPVVLKPARSRYLKGDRIIATSVEILQDPARLSATLDRQHWLGDIPCLVQRFVAGRGAGVFALYCPSGPLAWFAHRRIREKPPTGGISVLSESVPVDPTMQSAAAKLLSAVGWTGVAMVEFRISDDGMPYLMEVNGRFWGSLQLAIDCGVDFPWLLYRLRKDLPSEVIAPFVSGKRLRWLLGDLDSLIIELRHAPSIVHKAHAVAAFLRSFADMRCRQEILRAHDPRPGILEAWQWLLALLGSQRTNRA